MPDGSLVRSAPGFELDGKELVQRAQDALDNRGFEQTWEAARRLFLPDSQPFYFTNQTQGQRDRATTIDQYGQYCVRMHAGFLYGGIINGAGDWFKIVLEGPHGEEGTAQMLEVADETQKNLANVAMNEATGFTEQYYAMLLERTVFGNGCLYGGDRPGGLPIVHAAPLKDCGWERGVGHEPGGYWWRQTFTAAQAKAKFPGRALSEDIEKAAITPARRNDQFTFVHGVIDNPGWVPSVIDQMPPERQYASVWLLEDKGELVSSSYLASQPYQAFRCYRRANEDYGRGPTEEALETNAMAQRIGIAIIRGWEKTIDPTLLLPDDGVTTPPTNEPDGAIVVRADLMRQGHDPIRYLKPGAQPAAGQEWLQRSIYASMDRAFSRDLFSLPREPRMVESQILGLQEEQSRGVVPLMAPLYAPTARFLARLYDIRRRQGRMPVWPREMAGFKVSIEFRNPLEKAARLAEVRAFTQTLAIAVQCMQVDPAAKFAIKVVEGLQYAARVLGVPERFIATKEEVKLSIETAAKVVQQQAGMENALDASTVAKNIAPLAQAAATNQSTEAA